jgi:hypothetical protein
MDARSHEQELVGSWRIVRWLGSLLRKEGAINRHATMNSQNGNPDHEPNTPENGVDPTQPPEPDSPTEEFLAVLPEGTQLPTGFAAEAKKLGVDPAGSKHARYPYPEIPVGSGASADPASLGIDWRLNTAPDSEVYKEAIENPKDSLSEGERETLQTMIDMWLPPYTD